MSTDITIYETVNNVTVYEDVTNINVSDEVVNISIDQSTEETVVTISNDQGLQGPTGATGATGDTGPQGPQGPAGAIQSITAGNATISIGGTANNPTISVPDNTVNAGSVAASNITGTVAVGKGGTGRTSVTANSVLIGNGTAAMTERLVSTTGGPNRIIQSDSFGVMNGSIIKATGLGGGGQIIITTNGGIDSVLTPGLSPSTASNRLPDSTGGALVATNDTGTVTSSMIADGTIVNADISASAAIAQSKLAIQKYMTLTDATADILPRTSCNSTRAIGNGAVFFVAFIPEKNMTVSNISLSTQTVCVPLTGTNKFQVGIFTAGSSTPSSVTCVSFGRKERTTSTTIPAAFGSVGSNTLETFALGYTITNGGSPTANGAPTSVNLTAGTTYWIGILGHASSGFNTGAVVMGMSLPVYQVSPYVALNATLSPTSTDFAVGTAVSANPGASSCPWFRLS